MAREGRIEGRVSEDGTAYEIVQMGTVRQSIPIEDARSDEKLKKAIVRNSWAEIPDGD